MFMKVIYHVVGIWVTFSEDTVRYGEGILHKTPSDLFTLPKPVEMIIAVCDVRETRNESVCRHV